MSDPFTGGGSPDSGSARRWSGDRWRLGVAMTQPHPAGGGAAIATYVSLFLILFVFFIGLFSSARVERGRVQAVMASLDNAFGHLPSDLGLLPHGTNQARPDEVFARELGQMLGRFGALNVTPGSDGLLSVDIPVDRFFEGNSTRLVSAASPLLDQLAVTLQKTHAAGTDRNLRYRLIWRVAVPPDVKPVAPKPIVPGHDALGSGAPPPKPSDTAAAAALELERGAAFAAALYQRGCPGDAIAVTRVDASTVPTGGLRWLFVDFATESADGRAGGEGDAP